MNTTNICPAALGSKDQQPATYSPKTGLFYVPTNHVCMDYEPFKVAYTAGQPYVGATLSMYPPKGEENLGNFIAWDATTGELLWHGEPAPAPPGEPRAVPVSTLYGLTRIGLRITPTHRYRVRVIYQNPTGKTIAGGGMGVVGGLFKPDRAVAWPRTDASDSLYQKDLQHFLGTSAPAAPAGSKAQLTANPLEPMQAMTGYVVQVFSGDVVVGSTPYLSLFAVGLLLFVLTLLLNVVSQWVVGRFREVYE